MIWSALSFLAEPWFVIPWYVIGVAGAAWVVYDLRTKNTPLETAMKWAWPIIVVFFSVLGLALYLGTARAPGIGRLQGDEAKTKAYHAYERSMPRRVNGAVIHCVAGDGLGIMTAMVIARAFGFTFWQEFWFEYAVGFAFGWFIFQLKSMLMMTDSKLKALGMAFRGEFFSMLSVMGGMGAVMTYVTPSVVGAQPPPLTYAFWGFGMLGLVVGYVLTIPTNWLMVKLGWKHGMGRKEDVEPVRSRAGRVAVLASMTVWATAALVLPAWLTEVREGRPVRTPGDRSGSGFRAHSDRPLAVMKTALRETLELAASPGSPRADVTRALDAAMRTAEVGAKAAPGTTMSGAHHEIMRARRALQMGDPEEMNRRIHDALGKIAQVDPSAPTEMPAPLHEYEGAPVLNAQGVRIGEVASIRGDRIRLTLGGALDVFGFLDIAPDAIVSMPVDELVFGPARTLGKSWVLLPTLHTCWREDTYVARRIAVVSPGSAAPRATRRSG